MKQTIYSPSRIQKQKKCIFCGAVLWLDHHEFLNGPDRRHAAEDGLWVWACRKCHTRVQNDMAIMRNGQVMCQEIFEDEIGTRDDFRARYRKSYL